MSGERLRTALDGRARFLREKELPLPKRQPHLVRWAREFLLFTQAHGGHTFEQTLDLFLAEVGGSHGEQEHHPAIVGDVIYTSRIAYNLRTGKPLKGWQWVRGGHGCGTISTSSFCNFHRGDMPVMQELKTGRLRHLTSVTRPGCWINMLPAGGLILIPEASSGCTCSHSIQTSLALVPRGE